MKIGGGYIGVYIESDDPFFCMADKRGYVREHRLNMARHIGRPLSQSEIVHHKDGDRTNNDIGNLVLARNQTEHMIEHTMGYRDGFEQGYQDGLKRALDMMKGTEKCEENP